MIRFASILASDLPRTNHLQHHTIECFALAPPYPSYCTQARCGHAPTRRGKHTQRRHSTSCKLSRQEQQDLCQEILDSIGLQLETPATENRKRFIDPLRKTYNEIRDKRNRDTDAQEPIPPFVTPPWWVGPETQIDDDADKARNRHDRENEAEQNLSIYTDGSGINGQIGAAAVCPPLQQTRSVHMGTETTSTVYSAELRGISLALQIAKEYAERNGSRQTVAIYTDNQAAITSTAKPEGQSGAYILKEIAQQIQDIQDKGRLVKIRWIPAHVGVPGNEAADRAAKEATGWREDGSEGETASKPFQLHPLRTTLKTWCKAEVERAWRAKWHSETKGRACYRHTPVPTNRILRLHQGLSKRQSALLVQLRTEKIGLRDFLFQRRVPGVIDSKCECGARRQTASHILLTCRNHKDLRNREFGRLPGRHDLRAIMNNRKLATKAIRIIEQTQILGQRGIRNE